MASWKESLAIGEGFENFVIQDLNKKTNDVWVKNTLVEKYKYFDLINVYGVTIECKCDEKAEQTKNICIETHCDGNESGILVTTADYWMITDNIQGYLIKTSEIKRCIEEGHTSLYPYEPIKFQYMDKYPVKQGDGRNKLMNFYTIPTWLFSEYCVEVININEMTYNDIK